MPERIVRGRKAAYEARPPDLDPSAVTVLFIHGSGGDRDDWRAQLEGISDKVNMIAVELPGHGKSEPPTERSVDACADWLCDFVEALGLRRVVLVGCSLGSAVAIRTAITPPTWLEAIGLVGSGGRLKVHPAFLDGLKQDPEKALDMLTDVALSQSAEDSIKAKMGEKFRSCSPELIHGDLSACNEFDEIERLDRITVPTWIVVGEDDRLTPTKYSHFLKDKIPHARLNVIPKAGHLVMIERPEEFNDRLVDFVGSLG